MSSLNSDKKALHFMEQPINERSLQKIQHTEVQKDGGSKPSF